MKLYQCDRAWQSHIKKSIRSGFCKVSIRNAIFHIVLFNEIDSVATQMWEQFINQYEIITVY